jgi:hypothetical protein
MNTEETSYAPDALMLLSSHCAHCPGVLDNLAKMIKNGELGRLEVINLERHPESMREHNVRSVPWVRIGKHQLTGSQTLEALQQRVQWAITDHNANNNNSNQVADFDFLLSNGKASKVIETIKEDPTAMQAILALLSDPGTVLSTRIGIGVVFEEFAGSDLLKTLIPQLGKLTTHEDQRIRADAFHYLGMTNDESAIPFLNVGKDDPDEEIREIVADSLDALTTTNANNKNA